MLAHSKNDFGQEIATLEVTGPRYILAEFNTHRIFSRNSASSRAIPFKKMVEAVQANPFIPLAWQEDHKGMQGTEYLDDKPASYLTEDRDGKTFFDFQKFRSDISAKDVLDGIWGKSGHFERPNGSALHHMIDVASELNNYGVTKQLANRLLEPFMWHTIIVTSTEWENFFKLRCPKYHYEPEDVYFRSRKEYLKYWEHNFGDTLASGLPQTNDTLDWLKINHGKADIHIMFLAEAIYDVIKESTPKKLKANEWHLPYGDHILEQFGEGVLTSTDVMPTVPLIALVSSVMCARVSYTVPNHDLTEWTLTKYVTKALDLAEADPLHASPFEHCGKSMDFTDLDRFLRIEDGVVEEGWCRNFRGFIQLRQMVEKHFSEQ